MKKKEEEKKWVALRLHPLITILTSSVKEK